MAETRFLAQKSILPDRVSASLDRFVDTVCHGGEIRAKTFQRHDESRGTMAYLYESIALTAFSLLCRPVAISLL